MAPGDSSPVPEITSIVLGFINFCQGQPFMTLQALHLPAYLEPLLKNRRKQGIQVTHPPAPQGIATANIIPRPWIHGNAMNNDQPLATTLSQFQLQNPFLLASAPPTASYEQIKRAFSVGWAGAVIKTKSAGMGWSSRIFSPVFT